MQTENRKLKDISGHLEPNSFKGTCLKEAGNVNLYIFLFSFFSSTLD